MISLDPASTAPLVAQLVDAVSERIRSGSVAPGARLPSVRKLALQCGVSTLTVSNAYNRLVADGLLEARRASGYFVSARLIERKAPPLRRKPVPRQHRVERPAVLAIAVVDHELELQSLVLECMLRFRACWVTQASFGSAVLIAATTRRVARWRKNRT